MGVFTGSLDLFSAGSKLTAARFLTWLQALQALTASYTSYTPTVSGTGFSIGNGSQTGAYRQTGKAIDGWFAVVGGSTTNWGSAAWSIALPAASNEGTGAAIGVVQAALSSGAARFGGWLWQNGGSSVAPTREDSTRWSATVPLSFTNGSEIRGWFHYEAA